MSRIEGPPLPETASMTWVGDYARAGAEACPDRIALLVPELGTSYSYAQFEQLAARMADELRERGFGAGDRIAYYGRNNDLYFPLLLATIRLGIVMVPLNWRCAEPEIAFFIEDSGSRLIVCDADFEPVARSAAPAIPILLTEGGESLRRIMESDGPAVATPAQWDENAVILQLYTSGTTGRPKGVLNTHRALSLARHMELSWADFPAWEGGAIVSAMPNFHIGGMSWVLEGLLRRSTCVITGDASGSNLLRLLVEHKALATFAVPTVVRMMVDEARANGIRLPDLQTIHYGAAPMSPALLTDAIEILGCGFLQYFGMTEATGSTTALFPREHDLANPRLLGSVGRPYPGMAIEIRDRDARPVERGTPGEIWIRTPTAMREYWHRPDATAEALIDGWYRSGDGGLLDEQGYLFLTDRIKDMIVSGGENVYPGEVEEALRRFPDVYEVAVVGLPDPKWGETVAAVVECRPGTSVDTEELRDFARTQLAAYKCPKRFALIDALPRTASGKVQRAEAKKAMLAMAEDAG